MTRGAAVGLWVAWLAIASAGLAIRWLHDDPRLAGELPFTAVMLMFATMGAVLVARRPGNPIGWLLMSMAVLDAQDRLGKAVVADLPHLIPASVPVGFAVALSYVLNQYLVFSLIPLLLLLFPDGRLVSRRWAVAFVGPLVVGVAGGLASLLAAGPVRASIPDVAKPFGIEGLAPLADALRAVYFVSFVLGIVAGFASLVQRYRVGGSLQRQQVKWVAASASLIALYFVTLGLLLGVNSLFPGLLDERVVVPLLNALNPLTALSLPLAVAIAVLRYRLYDIDVLISRALVYGAVSALLAGAYFAAVVVLQGLLRPVTSGNELAVAGSTLLVVALFQPLRRRVQASVDRRFYRPRYDAARALDALGARLRDEVDLGSVRADLLNVVADTLHPAHAGVWLREARR